MSPCLNCNIITVYLGSLCINGCIGTLGLIHRLLSSSGAISYALLPTRILYQIISIMSKSISLSSKAAPSCLLEGQHASLLLALA
jgi:hypothetical protein